MVLIVIMYLKRTGEKSTSFLKIVQQSETSLHSAWTIMFFNQYIQFFPLQYHQTKVFFYRRISTFHHNLIVHKLNGSIIVLHLLPTPLTCSGATEMHEICCRT